MYAIVAVGGFQYRVAVGDTLQVPKVSEPVGSTLTLGDVLLLRSENETRFGTPTIPNTSITASVIGHAQADKITVFKKKRRKGYQRKRGHRQLLTLVRIDRINVPPVSEKASAKVKRRKKETEAAA